MTLTPARNTYITANIAQRMIAPGAEEFLAPATVGPWLPPERTFAPLQGEELRVERVRFVDVGISHEFDGTYVIGVRRFHQRVNEQLATLFGLPINGGPESPGHYFVASAGGVDAEGWGVRLSTTPTQRIRGSIDYSVARANWVSRGDMAAIAFWAPGAIRPQQEDIHDVTTSLETEVPQTSTRVFVLYKVNSAFARGPEARSDAGRRSTIASTSRSIRRCRSCPSASRALGSARRRAQPFPGSQRRRLALRRAAGGPAAQTRRRRRPRPLLITSTFLDASPLAWNWSEFVCATRAITL